MRDRNTTIAGVLTIVVAVAGAALEYVQHQPIDLKVLGTAFAAGIGLIKAADSK